VGQQQGGAAPAVGRGQQQLRPPQAAGEVAGTGAGVGAGASNASSSDAEEPAEHFLHLTEQQRADMVQLTLDEPSHSGSSVDIHVV
jgi:hypothetical protein